MHDDMLISVIMPAYNAASTISIAIDSVLTQTYENWELVVIDDCSTDSTVERVEQYLSVDSRIKLLTNKVNKGVAYTRKYGVNKCQGVTVKSVGVAEQ